MKLLKKNTNVTHRENINKYDVESELDSFLDRNNVVDDNDVPAVIENASIEDIKAEILKRDHDAINKLMLQTLSPQLSYNEEQKRSFKEGLMKYIKGVLGAQLVIVGVAFLAICIAVCCGVDNPILTNNIVKIFDFLQYYITAIIVEFIAILFFIVKFVFDKSIVGLLSDTIKKK